MKLNLKIRAKNLYFWVGIVGVILASTGTAPETLTTWSALAAWVNALIQNPYALVGCFLTTCGVLLDPTTAGPGDSTQALSYVRPKRQFDELEAIYIDDRRD